MEKYMFLFVVFLVTLANTEVKGHPSPPEKVAQASPDVLPVDDQFESMRSKRAVDPQLQAFRDQLFANLDRHRAEKDLREFEVDETLERGAQAWADELASEFKMSTSCVTCHDYSEVIGARRSSHPIPEGEEAGDWVFEKLFSEDDTYDIIISDKDNHAVGFGLAFSQNPEDFSYHAFAVLRFAHPVYHH